MNVTILGQGAMGARMADRLEDAGFAVVRWNRTGAVQTPAAAVRDADVVMAMVRDDAASRAVWAEGEGAALAAMKPGAIAIESSTVTPGWARTLAGMAQARGTAFLDAPVLGSRPQAEAGQLIHLIGGEADVIARVAPVLAAVGSARLHAGAAGAGAALKLVANALLAIQVAAVAELIGRMPGLGLCAETAIDLLGQTPVASAAARGAAGLMLSGRDAPLFPVELVAKDLGYAVGDASSAMPITEAAIRVFARAQAAGLADANLTAVSQLYAKAGAPEPMKA